MKRTRSLLLCGAAALLVAVSATAGCELSPLTLTVAQGGAAGVGGGTLGIGGALASSLTVPAGCWRGIAACNPLDPLRTCGSGQTCDRGETASLERGLFCFPAGNVQVPGGGCNELSGPYCQPGYRCDGPRHQSGVCRKICCSNSDCGAGVCAPFDASLGSFGNCVAAPETGLAGSGGQSG